MKRASIYGFIVLLVLLFGGCASTATMARIDGSNTQWRGFSTIPATPDLYREIDVTVKVIIVGDISQTGYPNAAGSYSNTQPAGTIRIIGKRVNGKIILPEAVIGHEVWHALQYQAGGFHDPDKLSDLGL